MKTTLQPFPVDKTQQSTILQMVEKNISSLLVISKKVNLPLEDVQDIINTMVSQNLLRGYISEDGTRFFRTDSRYRSSKPKEIQVEIENNFFTPGKIVFFTGLLMFIIGQIGSRMVAMHSLIWECLASSVVLGLLFILLGMILFSKE